MTDDHRTDDGTTAEADQRPLQFFPVAIGRYRHHDPLDTDTEVTGVADLLAPFGAEYSDWQLDPEQRGADAVEDRLREWSQPRTAHNTFLYWISHGESDGQTAALAHANSPRPLTAGGVSPEQLVGFLAARQAHRNGEGSWAVVVIDACKSGRFVKLMSARADLDPNGPQNFLLVATSDEGSANMGTFRKALSTILTVTFRAEDVIDLWDLGKELKRNLHGCPVELETVPGRASLHRRVPALAGALTASLDLLAEVEAALENLSDDERRHFIPKASGAELGEQAWYFEGREAECEQILGWLARRSAGMLVVTGAAGSGKSALLGHVLVRTRPDLMRVMARSGHLAAAADEHSELRDPFDAVIHLTGATPQDVVGRIAGAAGLGEAPSDQSLTVQTNWLLARMRQRRHPFTLLADALDEAHLPLVTADRILRALAALPDVRVIVGTRRSTQEGPDLPVPDDQDLLAALDASTATVIGVGRDSEAMTRYVHRRLTGAVHAGLLRLEEKAIADIAAAIGALDREFLYARLAVHEVIQTPSVLAEGVEELLASDHRQLFARAVDRLASLAPANRPLLMALGLAQGHGLPLRDGVWATVATALGDGVAVTDPDIEALTKAAAPYLMLDREGGQTVYRLAHRTFVEHFSGAKGLTEGHAEGQEDGHADRHSRITAELAADAEARLPSSRPNPYLVQHLAAHAALGGPDAWQALARHVQLLDHLNATAVTTGVMRSAFGRFELPAPVAGVVASQHLLSTAAPQDRRGIRELAATRYGQPSSPRLPGPPPQDPVSTWSVRWASMRSRSLYLTLTGHAGAVRNLVAFTGPDGRVLLASGADDGTLRLWDPLGGTDTGEPLTGHSGGVRALTALPHPAGHTLLATADAEGTLRLWNQQNGTPVDGPTMVHPGGVRNLVAFTGPDGRVLLASGADDGTLRLWDPLGGTDTGEPLTGHSGGVRALTALPHPAGHTLLATGDAQGTLRLWDPASRTCRLLGRQPGPARADMGTAVVALAALTGDDHQPLLISAGDDGRVVQWDPASDHQTTVPVITTINGARTLLGFRDPAGAPVLGIGSVGHIQLASAPSSTLTGASFANRSGQVNALASFSGPAGDQLLASGSADGRIRVWTAARHTTVPTPPRSTPTYGNYERHSQLRAVAAWENTAGGPLLATGSGDGWIRVWDAASGEHLRAFFIAPTRTLEQVNALAAFTGIDGRPRLATGDRAGRMRVWDPLTGTPVSRPMWSHGRSWLSLVAAPAPRGTLLACGGSDGQVRVWDAASGDPVGEPWWGHTAGVLSLAAFLGPQGVLLASGGADGWVKVWDPRTHVTVSEFSAPFLDEIGTVTAITDAAGRVLLAAGGTDGRIRVWDPLTGSPVTTLHPAHRGGVHVLAALHTRDAGHLLVSGGVDGNLRVWDPNDGFTSLAVPLEVQVRDIACLGTDLALATTEGVVLLSLKAAGTTRNHMRRHGSSSRRHRGVRG